MDNFFTEVGGCCFSHAGRVAVSKEGKKEKGEKYFLKLFVLQLIMLGSPVGRHWVL